MNLSETHIRENINKTKEKEHYGHKIVSSCRWTDAGGYRC